MRERERRERKKERERRGRERKKRERKERERRETYAAEISVRRGISKFSKQLFHVAGDCETQ